MLNSDFRAIGPLRAETVARAFTDKDQRTAVSISAATYVSDIHYDLFGRQSKVFYGNVQQ